jgi:hypothetical protein
MLAITSFLFDVLSWDKKVSPTFRLLLARVCD